MIFRKSVNEDINKLVNFSKRAFDSDITVGGTEIGGPPDYDSVSWHRQMREEGHLYTLQQDNGEVVGGAVLFDNEDCLFVGRIFVNPDFFHQGYGIVLMDNIEKTFPNVKCIKLDTPVWNIRTNNFYKKCGYIETGRDEESVYYEKAM